MRGNCVKSEEMSRVDFSEEVVKRDRIVKHEAKRSNCGDDKSMIMVEPLHLGYDLWCKNNVSKYSVQQLWQN